MHLIIYKGTSSFVDMDIIYPNTILLELELELLGDSVFSTSSPEACRLISSSICCVRLYVGVFSTAMMISSLSRSSCLKR